MSGGSEGGNGPTRAALVVRNPTGAPQMVAIERLPFRIGRHGDNDLVLRDSRTSRHHAEIVAEGGGYVVRDLGSSYGLFVNGRKVERAALRPADRIEFGFPDSYQLTFTLGGAGPVAEAAVEEPPGTGTATPGLTKLRATLEVARALESSLSTDEVLAAVVDAALTITGCERGFLLLRKGDDLDIRIARSHAGPLEPDELRVPTRLLFRALAQRKECLSMRFDVHGGEAGAVERSIYDLELRSAVCVPLVRVRSGAGADAETLALSRTEDTAGLLYMDSRARDADLSLGGRELLTTLAIEASTILENARLIEELWARQRIENELRIARQIQDSLLPRSLPATGWLRAAGSSVPSLQVGGDSFDVRAINAAVWAIVEADVSGKGVGAALLASLMQGMFLASPTSALTIEETMERIGRYLSERTGGEQYATAFYGTLDGGGSLRWVNAGHPPVLLVRGGGEVETLAANGTPLGMIEGATYSVAETVLKPGNKLVVYTDGLIDAENEAREPFGFARLRETVRSKARLECRELHAAILAAVERFVEGAPPADDITLVVIEYQPFI